MTQIFRAPGRMTGAKKLDEKIFLPLSYEIYSTNTIFLTGKQTILSLYKSSHMNTYIEINFGRVNVFILRK